MEKQKNMISEFAIASLVIGIFSFIQLWGMEKPLMAIAFGILALRGIKKSEMRGKNLAIAGIILGIIAIIAITIITIAFFPQLKQMMLKLE